MRKLIFLLVVIFLSFTSMASDIAALAVPQAEKLVQYMRSFDTEGVASLLYTEPMIRLGADPEQMKHMAAQLDQKLKNSGANYSSFELGQPTNVFGGPDGAYTIIPYTCVLDLGGRKIAQEAFFLAVSADNGKTWKFLDGIATARVPIDVILPGYAGPPLPNVARRPIE